MLGASGFIGSRVVSILRSVGVECYAPLKDDPEIFEKELGKVFYCVGMTADYIKNQGATVSAHVSHLSKIIERAKFDRLVYSSSTRLYDGLGDVLATEETVLSYNKKNPRHLYDLSKALGENLTLTATGGRWCVVRLSCVYDSSFGSPGFMSILLQQLSESCTLTLDSSTGFLRDYIFVDDVVYALKAILDSDKCAIFNVASGENITNKELSEFLSNIGCVLKIANISEKQVMPVCDISKIKNLGINPILVMDFIERNIKGRR